MPKGVYDRNKTHEQRFWDCIDRNGPVHPVYGQCWVYLGKKSRKGYGRIVVLHKDIRVHRFAYELCVGSIPTGLCVLHHCDNPNCVRPSHLFLGTNHDNVNDKVKKRRQVQGVFVHTAKLTTAIVRSIRSRGKLSREDCILIANEFGVLPSTIRNVVNRQTWKGVK
jgi:hypothetical protein